MQIFKIIIKNLLLKILLFATILLLTIIARAIKIIHTLYIKHKLKMKKFYKNLLECLVMFKQENKKILLMDILKNYQSVKKTEGQNAS